MVDNGKKGTYGYVRNKKIKLIIYLVITLIIAFAIYFTGYFFSGKSNKNLGTILAVLMVLPGAKIFVTLILLVPFKGLKEKHYNAIYQKVQNMNNDCVKGHKKIEMLYNMVLTSPQQVMYLDAMAIAVDRYVVLTSKKSDKSHISSYIKKYMSNYGYEKEVVIYTNFDEFIRNLDCAQDQEEEDIKEITLKLMVLEV